jgi:hypothetical protein
MQKKRNIYATKAELSSYVFNLCMKHAPGSPTDAHSDRETTLLPLLFTEKLKKFQIFCIAKIAMHETHPMKDEENLSNLSFSFNRIICLYYYIGCVTHWF